MECADVYNVFILAQNIKIYTELAILVGVFKEIKYYEKTGLVQFFCFAAAIF